MGRTIQELAKESLDVQNACNASGVVHAMSRMMTDLWEIAREKGKGTDWVNQHPIVIVYLDKLASLADCQEYNSKVFKAFDQVSDLAEGKEIQY